LAAAAGIPAPDRTPRGKDAPGGASLELRKRIPAGAGLGGGSSDAAAALRALNDLWKLNWPLARLREMAAGIGSDVPLFLEPGSAVIRGRGERVERLRESWRGWAVVVVPPFGVSTAAVYGRWKAAPASPSRSTSNKRQCGTGVSPVSECGTGVSPVSAPAGRRCHIAPWTAGAKNALELLGLLFNDLETAAFECEPRLAALHGRLDRLEGRPVRLTGSGSCLFTLFDSQAEARAWGRAAADAAGESVRLRVVEVI
jgi:4-diphosphocytidyl-2-C-methyl-D-erythritol kinase